ncbi:helix-turn-helix domain-containing protein [Chryseobacterium gambrini]|uniref:Helix-turn-helix domain-containing protein n=1 Tax=Chryseobacterium gambrini TaxID=373672 RepID=A0AAJ1R3Y5_9FLAO|nr:MULTISPECIES: helix-turn-helix domain-containing protein [Chryseobacterium]MDN4011907.1 helix-turn-helix domain-containing protein [Chryseobacterium gambrini]MDN4029386.1 helix-turn-helix domain-containing protein [Chryseobacterium gambrini]QWA40603.1 helix-turn-helix domain-containing protein [Chryseobacterium sp. ZHDP1]
MDREVQHPEFRINSPDYKRIYTDILEMRYRNKKDKCEALLNKPRLSVMDILELEKRIFDEKEITDEKENKKFRAYDDEAILQILRYQKNNNMNNNDTAAYFKVSRNSVAKWKRLFPKI